MKELKVVWTGEYPCLCSGEWIITFNNVKLNIPKDKKREPMNTLKEYSQWYFDEDCSECYYYIEEGLNFNDWIIVNRYWVEEMFKDKNIEVNEQLLKDLYFKIRLKDWKRNSCGGCI